MLERQNLRALNLLMNGIGLEHISLNSEKTVSEIQFVSMLLGLVWKSGINKTFSSVYAIKGRIKIQ